MKVKFVDEYDTHHPQTYPLECWTLSRQTQRQFVHHLYRTMYSVWLAEKDYIDTLIVLSSEHEATVFPPETNATENRELVCRNLSALACFMRRRDRQRLNESYS